MPDLAATASRQHQQNRRRLVAALLLLGIGSQAPDLLGQGVADTTVPALTTRLLVGRMCGRSEPVIYREYPGAGHYDAIAVANPDVVAYVGDRFAGAAATSSC